MRLLLGPWPLCSLNAAANLNIHRHWNAKLRPPVLPQPAPAPAQAAMVAAQSEIASNVEPFQARPHRISWARLLKGVFDIDQGQG